MAGRSDPTQLPPHPQQAQQAVGGQSRGEQQPVPPPPPSQMDNNLKRVPPTQADDDVLRTETASIAASSVQPPPGAGAGASGTSALQSALSQVGAPPPVRSESPPPPRRGSQTQARALAQAHTAALADVQTRSAERLAPLTGGPAGNVTGATPARDSAAGALATSGPVGGLSFRAPHPATMPSANHPPPPASTLDHDLEVTLADIDLDLQSVTSDLEALMANSLSPAARAVPLRPPSRAGLSGESFVSSLSQGREPSKQSASLGSNPAEMHSFGSLPRITPAEAYAATGEAASSVGEDNGARLPPPRKASALSEKEHEQLAASLLAVTGAGQLQGQRVNVDVPSNGPSEAPSAPSAQPQPQPLGGTADPTSHDEDEVIVQRTELTPLIEENEPTSPPSPAVAAAVSSRAVPRISTISASSEEGASRSPTDSYVTAQAGSSVPSAEPPMVDVRPPSRSQSVRSPAGRGGATLGPPRQGSGAALSRSRSTSSVPAPAALGAGLHEADAVMPGSRSLNRRSISPDGRLGAPGGAPSAPVAEDLTPHLFWVPAHQHPEIAPLAFKEWLERHDMHLTNNSMQRVRRRKSYRESVNVVSVHKDESGASQVVVSPLDDEAEGVPPQPEVPGPSNLRRSRLKRSIRNRPLRRPSANRDKGAGHGKPDETTGEARVEKGPVSAATLTFSQAELPAPPRIHPVLDLVVPHPAAETSGASATAANQAAPAAAAAGDDTESGGFVVPPERTSSLRTRPRIRPASAGTAGGGAAHAAVAPEQLPAGKKEPGPSRPASEPAVPSGLAQSAKSEATRPAAAEKPAPLQSVEETQKTRPESLVLSPTFGSHSASLSNEIAVTLSLMNSGFSGNLTDLQQKQQQQKQQPGAGPAPLPIPTLQPLDLSNVVVPSKHPSHPPPPLPDHSQPQDTQSAAPPDLIAEPLPPPLAPRPVLSQGRTQEQPPSEDLHESVMDGLLAATAPPSHGWPPPPTLPGPIFDSAPAPLAANKEAQAGGRRKSESAVSMDSADSDASDTASISSVKKKKKKLFGLFSKSDNTYSHDPYAQSPDKSSGSGESKKKGSWGWLFSSKDKENKEHHAHRDMKDVTMAERQEDGPFDPSVTPLPAAVAPPPKKKSMVASLFKSSKKKEAAAAAAAASAAAVAASAAHPSHVGAFGLKPMHLPHRFPIHIERAICRLAHQKLANPRRPLHDQVQLSNMLVWYMSLRKAEEEAMMAAQAAQASTEGVAGDGAAAGGPEGAASPGHAGSGGGSPGGSGSGGNSSGGQQKAIVWKGGRFRSNLSGGRKKRSKPRGNHAEMIVPSPSYAPMTSTGPRYGEEGYTSDGRSSGAAPHGQRARARRQRRSKSPNHRSSSSSSSDADSDLSRDDDEEEEEEDEMEDEEEDEDGDEFGGEKRSSDGSSSMSVDGAEPSMPKPPRVQPRGRGRRRRAQSETAATSGSGSPSRSATSSLAPPGAQAAGAVNGIRNNQARAQDDEDDDVPLGLVMQKRPASVTQ